MDGTITIKVSGLSEIVSAMRAAPSIMAPILQKAIVAATQVLQQYTVRGIVPYRTGNLRSSFRTDFSPFKATYYPTANYAPYVYWGTGLYDPAGPHLIYPKSATVMAWNGPNGPVFARYTKGQPGQPYMDAIAAAATPGIQELFKQAVGLGVSAIASAGAST